MQNQSNSLITFDTQLKTALSNDDFDDGYDFAILRYNALF